MKRALSAFLACLCLLGMFGCQDLPDSETVTPEDMFESQAKPVGDPSLDPYSPERAGRLLEIPLGPRPEEETARPGGGGR